MALSFSSISCLYCLSVYPSVCCFFSSHMPRAGPITRRFFPREAFQREVAQVYVSAWGGLAHGVAALCCVNYCL